MENLEGAYSMKFVEETAMATKFNLFDQMAEHEQVVFCNDPATGLRAIIAIHNTTLGPALGGCRMQPYESVDEALEDYKINNLKPISFGTKAFNKNNQEVDLEVTGKVLVDKEGKLMGFQGSTRDIGERKKAQKLLAESEIKYKTLVEQTPQALCEAVKRALKVYENKEDWRKLVETVMKIDFSWRKSAEKYFDMYSSLANIEENNNE